MELIFSHQHGEIPGFEKFIMTANPSKYPEDFYLAKLWFISFNCMVSESDCKILEKCPLNASLGWLPSHCFDMAMTEGSNNAYNAVYAVAWTLHEMLLQQVEMQTMGSGEGLVFSPWQVMSLSFNSMSCHKCDFLTEFHRAQTK